MGAMVPPNTMPPLRLLGTWGMSSPISQLTELMADLREEPVPTTSPAKATALPSWRKAAMVASPAGNRLRPKKVACKGMSARDWAWLPGEKSSVLISPSTLYTVQTIRSGTWGLAVNHSAAAQDSRTLRAAGFCPARATTWSKAS